MRCFKILALFIIVFLLVLINGCNGGNGDGGPDEGARTTMEGGLRKECGNGVCEGGEEKSCPEDCEEVTCHNPFSESNHISSYSSSPRHSYIIQGETQRIGLSMSYKTPEQINEASAKVQIKDPNNQIIEYAMDKTSDEKTKIAKFNVEFDTNQLMPGTYEFKVIYEDATGKYVIDNTDQNLCKPLTFQVVTEDNYKCNVILKNDGPEDKKLNIVYVSDSFDDEADYNEKVNTAFTTFFSTEPFKSYQDRFNVYSVWSNDVYNCWNSRDSSCHMNTIKLIALKSCNLEHQPYLFVLDPVTNNKGFPPNRRGYAQRNFIFVFTDKDEFPITILHEFGHGFGGLHDEYVGLGPYGSKDFFNDLSYNGALIKRSVNLDHVGCPKWCSGEPNTDSKCYEYYSVWDDCLKTEAKPSECWVNVNEYIKNKEGKELWEISCELGKGCPEGTGCFWGGYYANAFRQEFNTIMRNPDEPGFDHYAPIAVEHMAKKLEEGYGIECSEDCEGESQITLSIPEISVNGYSVDINGYVSSDDGEIIEIEWDWGDGKIDKQWFPATHHYTEKKNYDISITALDDKGNAKTVGKKVRLLPSKKLTITGSHVSMIDFPEEFFDGPEMSPKRVVEIMDIIFEILADAHHNSLIPDRISFYYSDEGIAYSDSRQKKIVIGKGFTPDRYHPWHVYAHEMSHNIAGQNPLFLQIVENGYSAFLDEHQAVIIPEFVYRTIEDNPGQYGITKNELETFGHVFYEGREVQENGYDEYISNGMEFYILQDDLEKTGRTSQALNEYILELSEGKSYSGIKIFNRALKDDALRAAGIESPSPEELINYIISAHSLAFKTDLRRDMRDLNFPVNDELYNLYSNKLSDYLS